MKVRQNDICENPKPYLHEERVGVAVVAAVELDHLLAAGEGADEPDHAHARLGARVGEAHHLDRRHGLRGGSCGRPKNWMTGGDAKH